MQRQISPSSNTVEISQMGLSLLLKTTALLLLVTIIFRFYNLSQAEAQHQAEQLAQARLILQLEQLKSSQNYDLCMSEAQQVPLDSPYRSQATALTEQCQNLATSAVLSRAQALAANGQPQAAIVEVRPILDRAGVRPWVEAWSRQILQTADLYYRDSNGGLQPALQTAATIAADNTLYPETQQQMQRWQADWLSNQTHWQAAHLALSQRQPQMALAEIQQITHPYWRQQAQALVNAIYVNPQPQIPAQPGTAPPAEPSTDPPANPPADLPAGSSFESDYLQVQRDSEGVVLSGKVLLPVSLTTVVMGLMRLRRR